MPASDPPAERQQRMQRDRLRRNRRIATGLLGTMAVLFLALKAIPEPGFWERLAMAMTEAAVIGGLADWFAVTALFRRPMGLPIPHTAVIPRSKDRLAQGLGRFIEGYFLESTVVARKLAALDVADHLARWLATPEHAAWLARRTVRALPPLIEAAEDSSLRDFVDRTLGEQLRQAPVGPVLGKALGLYLASGQHAPILEKVVEAGGHFIERNRGRLEAAVGRNSSWWVPRTVDRRLARTVIDGVRQLLNELLDPASPGRQGLEDALRAVAADLRNSAALQAKLETAKERFLEHPDVRAWLEAAWEKARRAALASAGSPDSKAVAWTGAVYRSLGESLAADAGMRTRLNGLILRGALDVVGPARAGVGGFIADVVRDWDTHDLIDRLELAVGSDLQYVRVSGTLVAAVIGGLLFLAGAGFR